MNHVTSGHILQQRRGEDLCSHNFFHFFFYLQINIDSPPHTHFNIMGYFVQIRTSNLNEVQPYQKKSGKVEGG